MFSTFAISDYRKKVLLLFLFKYDDDLLRGIGFSERDIHRLNLEFKTIMIEEPENYLDYVKDQEEKIVEKILNRLMEQFFEINSEDVIYERSHTLFLGLVEPDILKQSKFTDHGIESIEKFALVKLHRQRNLKEIIALD